MNLFYNYLKVSFRNLLKRKYFFILNIICLSIGILSFLLISNFIIFEKAYDKFHDNSENIYRVVTKTYKAGEIDVCTPGNPHPLGPLVNSEFDEVQNHVRLHKLGNNIGLFEISSGEVKMSETSVLFADPSFFSVFSFDLVVGSKTNALNEPNQIVISESLAKKYFNSIDVIGTVLQLKHPSGIYSWTISGVIEDMPKNSHLKFDMLAPMENIRPIRLNFNDTDNWGAHGWFNYLVLKEGTDYKAFEKKMQKLLDKRSWWVKNQKKTGIDFTYTLQPLKDIHFKSEGYSWDIQSKPGNINNLIIIFISSIFILLISYINYVLFQINNSTDRNKELGIRKMLGTTRFKLFINFFMESLVFNLLVILISLVIVYVLKPYFYSIYGLQISIHLFTDVLLVLAFIFTVFITVIFTSWIISNNMASLSSLNRIRNSISTKNKLNIPTRKTLIVIQFVAAIVLILATSIIYLQIHFMENADIKTDIENTVRIEPIMNKDSIIYTNIHSLVTELKRQKEVEMVSVDNESTINEITWIDIFSLKERPNEATSLYDMYISPEFLPIFNIEVLAGRNYSKKIADNNSVILNEAAINKLGLEAPEMAIGKYITQYGRDFQIIGVIENYYNESLRESYKPIVFFPNFVDNSYLRIKYIHIKLNCPYTSEINTKLSSMFKDVFPDKRIKLDYLPDLKTAYYKEDRNQVVMFSIFTLIAIFLSCIGVISITIFDVKKRTKEIAIRKQCGSSIFQIILLIAFDMIKYISFSVIIGLPIAYYLMNDWLQKFSLRIEMPWAYYFFVVGIILTLPILATSTIILKAARQNPIIALRTE